MDLKPNYLIIALMAVVLFGWYRLMEFLALRLSLRKREKAKRMGIIFAVWWKIAVRHVITYLAFRGLNTFISIRMTEIFTAYYEHYETRSVEWLLKFADGILTNPFKHPSCIIFELILIFFSAVLCFLSTRGILDRTRQVDLSEAKNAALAAALLTAPWTFLLPTFYF